MVLSPSVYFVSDMAFIFLRCKISPKEVMIKTLKDALCCFDMHVFYSKQITQWNVYDQKRRKLFSRV